MSNEARLNELLDLVEQARSEGDAETERRAIEAYKVESSGNPNSQMEHKPTPMAPWDAGQGVATEMSGPQQFAAGMGMNLARLGRYTGNKVGLVPDSAVAEADKLDESLKSTMFGRGGDMTGGAVWTTLPAMLATGGASQLGTLGKTIASNPVLRGGLEGAVQGGLQAKPGDTGKGILFGGATGMVLPTIAQGGRVLANGLPVTPEARTLLNKGVDLTPGQMNPQGNLNAMESDLTKIWGIGPAFAGARKHAETQYKQLLINEAAAPGAKLTPNDDLSAMLDDAYKSFKPAYAPARPYPVQTVGIFPVTGANRTLADDFADAVNDPNILSSDATKSTTAKWLQNQLTKAPKTTGDLIDLRSQVRSKIRSISGTSQDDIATKEILSNAEQALTQSLDNWLPQDVAAQVKAADAQYGKFKIVENAVGKGGDKDFTTFQASKAVREATDKGQYARGSGRLRDLTSAGASTFIDTPATGVRAMNLPILIAAAKNPTLGIPGGLSLAGLTLTKTGRNIASGDTAFQAGLRDLGANTIGRIPANAREAIAQLMNRGSVAGLDKWLNTRQPASE